MPATHPTPPPKPTRRPRDWLDDILNSPPPKPPSPPAPTPVAPKPPKAKPVPAQPGKRKKKRRKRPGPDTPRSAFGGRQQSPRQSLMDAWDAVPYRLKWLAYHLAAAYLGWSVGLVDWWTYVTAWLAATGLIGVQAFFWYAVAVAELLLYRRTRGAWLPVAWLAAVPATSTVAGVLLYGTPHP